VDVLRTPEERFALLSGYPFTPRYAELPEGLRVHYVDEGPHEAETVLLLHGQPTWSFLYRKVIDRLVAHGLRAVAPDLVGFGRSDKPLTRTAHSVPGHVAWMAQFTAAIALRNVTLVVQDWGGPIGLALLTERPGLVRRVVAANTALHTADASLAGRLSWLVAATEDGTVTVAQMLLDYQRLTQELVPFRPSMFVQGATMSDVPDDVLAAYDAPFPDESFCAGPRQLPLLMGLTPSSACARINRHTLGALSAFDGPFLTAFSDGDPGTGGWAEVLRDAVPGARARAHVTIAGAGHFLQEDCGAELADVVARLMAETPLPQAPS
jgi:haloalkane dehalogenase